MSVLLILPLLGFWIFLLAEALANERGIAWLYSVLVLVMGNALCKATNWMDEEKNEDT